MAFSKICVNLIYKESDEIVAFISATTNSKKLFRDILFKKWSLFLLIVLFNLAKMRQFKNIMDTFLYFSKVSKAGIDAELLFIAIEPNYRGKGIAQDLIEYTLKELRCRGIQAVKVSVEKNNSPVNQLLEKMKFCRVKTFSLFKKEMNLYTYTLR
jgi:ribosomal protein S18 acetylase RimI-like enzyme